MKRRQGFTIVELLVAMALIMFIMAILSAAFVAATKTFRDLKAAGDMAEKLRATTQLLQRDLAADHFEGKKRLSSPQFWVNGPPEQGFFQIFQGSAGTAEGADLPAGVVSNRSTNHALAFTIKHRGNQMGDFLTASAPGQLVAASMLFGPPEARYQTSEYYNFQWAEVAWFLQPSIGPTGQPDTTVVDPVSGALPEQLFTLIRRQRLAVPDNSLVTQANTPPGGILNAQTVNTLELSCWPNLATGFLFFNNPMDLTVPQKRFGGSVLPPPFGTLPVLTACPTLTSQGAAGSLAGADIQLTDVVSFDVRVLPQTLTAGRVDPFVTLFDPAFAGFLVNGNPSYNQVAGPMVFDTWSSVNDGSVNPPGAVTQVGYSQWNTPGQLTSIPLWNGSTGPIIQAVQITIRIWDSKTNQTRQVTIVQAM